MTQPVRRIRHLSRQELYDMVWQTPMSRLGEEFGISDKGLAKICARMDIPCPPRGYWAQKAAGRAVQPAPLPPREESHEKGGNDPRHCRTAADTTRADCREPSR